MANCLNWAQSCSPRAQIIRLPHFYECWCFFLLFILILLLLIFPVISSSSNPFPIFLSSVHKIGCTLIGETENFFLFQVPVICWLNLFFCLSAVDWSNTCVDEKLHSSSFKKKQLYNYWILDHSHSFVFDHHRNFVNQDVPRTSGPYVSDTTVEIQWKLLKLWKYSKASKMQIIMSPLN